jgi:integrase
VPHIGDKLLQKMKPTDIEAWHNTLRTSGRKDGKGGISTRTIKHAHRVLSKALDDAVRNDLCAKNVAKLEGAPTVDDDEVRIIPREQIGGLIDKLRGRAIYARAIVALFTGMRRGEVLALRWSNVDLDGKVIRIREALEETKEHDIQVKAPKTKAGKRDVSLPTSWSMPCAITAGRSSSFASRSAPAGCPTMPWCSRPRSRAVTSRRGRSPKSGRTSPRASACPK